MACWTIRDTDDHSCNTRATDRARHGASRSITLGDSSLAEGHIPAPVAVLPRLRFSVAPSQ